MTYTDTIGLLADKTIDFLSENIRPMIGVDEPESISILQFLEAVKVKLIFKIVEELGVDEFNKKDLVARFMDSNRISDLIIDDLVLFYEKKEKSRKSLDKQSVS